MAEPENVADDWELSKENVQPLRQGRSFTEMSAAIQPSNAARIKQEQEYAFRRYCGKTRKKDHYKTVTVACPHLCRLP